MIRVSMVGDEGRGFEWQAWQKVHCLARSDRLFSSRALALAAFRRFRRGMANPKNVQFAPAVGWKKAKAAAVRTKATRHRL